MELGEKEAVNLCLAMPVWSSFLLGLPFYLASWKENAFRNSFLCVIPLHLAYVWFFLATNGLL